MKKKAPIIDQTTLDNPTTGQHDISKNTKIRVMLQTHPNIIPITYDLIDIQCLSKPRSFCTDMRCSKCYNKSFCIKPRSQFWSSENTTTPRMVSFSSGNGFWFNCHNCPHKYLQAPHSIETNVTPRGNVNGKFRDSKCPVCYNNGKCGDVSCVQCRGNSFASSPMVTFWSPLNKDLSPSQIQLGSGKNIILTCPNCPHHYRTTPIDIKRGRRCPYCAGKTLCDGECLDCYKNSFASHQDSTLWSPKNSESPRGVFLCSSNKYLFVCKNNNHEYENTPNNIVQFNTGCPHCKFKTETKLYNWLLSQNLSVVGQKKYEWSKSSKGSYLPFDFAIEDLKLIIENDGPQHFSQVSNWQLPERTRETDTFKMYKALENGYSCIRILQTDVLYDKNNWQSRLMESIKKYDLPTIIYINDGDVYEAHKYQLKINQGITLPIVP